MLLNAALNNLRFHIIPVIVFTGILLFLYAALLPPTKLSTHIFGGDSLINAYLINWVQHTMWSNPAELYNTPIFVPQKTAGAFSSVNIFLGAITSPLRLFGNGALSYNLAMYVAVWLSGMTMYGTAFWLTQHRRAAVLAALIFSCNGDMFWHFAGHPNIISPIFLPPLLGITIAYWQKPNWALALTGCFLLIGQFLCDWYLGFIAILCMGPVLGLKVLASLKSDWRHHVLSAVFILGTLVIIHGMSAPYREVSERFGNTRLFQEHIMNSAEVLTGYVLPSHHENRNETWIASKISTLPKSARTENSQYLGLIGMMFSLVLIIHFVNQLRLKREESASIVVPIFLCGMLGFLFSLGPYLWVGNTLHNIKLPWAYVYDLAVPLRFMRAVSRFSVCVYLAAALFSALAVQRISVFNSVIHWKRFAVFTAILMIYVLDQRPIAGPGLVHYSAARENILSNSGFNSIAGIPLTDNRFLMDGAQTFPTTISGYFGGAINSHFVAVDNFMRNFPDEKSLGLLAATGMQGAAVYDQAMISKARQNAALTEQAEADGMVLFKLNVEAISPEAIQQATRFLESLSEKPGFSIAQEKPVLDPMKSIPLKLQYPVQIIYHSPWSWEKAVVVEVEPQPVETIKMLWLHQSLTCVGTDFVPVKVYFITQEDPTWNEEKSIEVFTKPNSLEWVFVDWRNQQEKRPTEHVTTLRLDLSAAPYLGQRLVLEEAFLVLE